MKCMVSNTLQFLLNLDIFLFFHVLKIIFLFNFKSFNGFGFIPDRYIQEQGIVSLVNVRNSRARLAQVWGGNLETGHHLHLRHFHQLYHHYLSCDGQADRQPVAGTSSSSSSGGGFSSNAQQQLIEQEEKGRTRGGRRIGREQQRWRNEREKVSLPTRGPFLFLQLSFPGPSFLALSLRCSYSCASTSCKRGKHKPDSQ